VLRMKVLEGELQQTEDENLKRLRPQRNKNYMTGYYYPVGKIAEKKQSVGVCF